MKTDALVLKISDEELQIIEIWRKKKIPVKKAKDIFSANLQNSEFDGIWSLKYEVDRIKFLRYLFTGCLFMEEDSAECGNPTMYSKLNGYTKTVQFENFFKSVNLLSKHLMKPRKKYLFDEICSVTLGKLFLILNLLSLLVLLLFIISPPSPQCFFTFLKIF